MNVDAKIKNLPGGIFKIFKLYSLQHTILSIAPKKIDVSRA